MVLDVQGTNGQVEVETPVRVPPVLPELMSITAEEARRIPSPGAQRALKAETGKGFDELCGPEADGADRTQTLVWMKLRKLHPDLRWADCAEVAVQVDDVGVPVDPTQLVASETSPGSAVSGG